MSKRVLLIDYPKSARELVSMTLSPEGFKVIKAVDGTDGQSEAKNNSCHLIITDYTMPNMDGLSLLKILQELPKYSNPEYIRAKSGMKAEFPPNLIKSSSFPRLGPGWPMSGQSW
jgi:CheY-like chemotaxis protein